MTGGWGLRSRVTVSFAVLALISSLLLGILIYGLVRNFLVDQFETSAINRAQLDAGRVERALEGGRTDYSSILDELPAGADAQPMLRVASEWFASGVTVAPADLPGSLLTVAEQQGASLQRFTVQAVPYLAVAVQGQDSLYVEVSPMSPLGGVLDTLALSAAGAAAAVSILGGFVGYQAGQRLMRPLRRLSATADRITEGERNVRFPDSDDPDLAPITDAFNDMSRAVEARIERERRFVANVSHELRSPITAMMGTVDLVQPRLDQLPPREARLLEVLCSSVRRFNGMVLDLLEVSKVTASPLLQVEEVDVRDAVEDLLVARGLGDKLYAGPEVRVFTDVRHLRRVMFNLVDNAGKHGGGLVSVTVRTAEPSERVEDRPGAVVDVDDAGPGVPTEDAARLFEPFARGSGTETVEGMGLGLAIAGEHARAISGQVRVLVSPAGGARFRLLIPSLPHDPAEAGDDAGDSDRPEVTA
jgi:two-component system, OmpR family, sensor histidine kinase MtrB